MNRLVLCALCTTAVLTIDARPAPAIDFGLGLFKRKPKPEPTSKVQQLITILQSSPDERQRRQAAEELRTIDPRTYPDLLPALITSLQRDPSPAVRAEAVATIGRLKPVNASAGIAMETSLHTDPDVKVREAIKGALWQYHVNGYRSPQGASTLTSQTSEPPLASGRPAGMPSVAAPRTGPAAAPSPEGQFRPITNSVGKGVFYQPTVEPPLAKPRTTPAASRPQPEVPPPAGTVLPPPLPAGSVPEPMSSRPATPTLPGGIPTVTPPPVPGNGLPTIPTPPPAGKGF